MSRFEFMGWMTDGIGRVSADIYCPHGKCVDLINQRDYSLSHAENVEIGNIVTIADFRQRVTEIREDAESGYCFLHEMKGRKK